MFQPIYGTLGGPAADPLAAAAAALLDPVLSGQDTTLTKLFVGGLPYHTTDKTLQEYFEQFGEIDEAVVITDRQTGKSRGYGFVTMKDRGGADRACKDPNPIIDGRKANVNLAYLGAKPRANVQLAGLPFPLQAASLAPLLNPANRLGVSPVYYQTPTSPLLGAGSTGLILPQTPNQYLDYNVATSAALLAGLGNGMQLAAIPGQEQYTYSPTYGGLVPNNLAYTAAGYGTQTLVTPSALAMASQAATYQG